MKKITIFTLNLEYGGIEKYISTLAEMFHNDYKVEIISTFKSVEKPVFSIPENVKITYLINEKPDNVSIKKLIKGKQIIKVFKEIVRRKNLKRLAHNLNKRVLLNIDSDIIITARIYHNDLVTKYCKNNNILKIATDHNFHQNDKKYINCLLKSIEGFDYLIVSSNELAEFYKKYNIHAKVIMIPNSLSKISTLKTKLNSKNIISIGRFSPEKGFLDLISLMKLINKKDKDICLTLIGDGFQNDEIQKKIDELNLRKYIITPGYLSQIEQEKYLLNSSLYIMTSFTESFGLVLIEAMSYGLPCVAFDCASGPRELLNNEVGYLIPNRDIDIMAERIVELLNNREEIINKQGNIKNFIALYSLDNVQKEWKKILNRKKQLL